MDPMASGLYVAQRFKVGDYELVDQHLGELKRPKAARASKNGDLAIFEFAGSIPGK